jgi:hypothetical protein
MRHRLCWFGAFTLLLAFGLGWQLPSGRSDPDGKKGSKPEKVRPKQAAVETKTIRLINKLQVCVLVEKGFPVGTTLGEVIKYLNSRFKICIVINPATFRVAREGLPLEEDSNEPLEKEMVKLAPVVNLPLANVLRRVLDQVGATYVIRQNSIEITAKEWVARHLLREKVLAHFDNRPLGEALRELSEQTGASVLVDGRLGDKAKTPVSATLKNDVTLETAVRLLADMSSLKAVLVGGTLYVTTKENAAALRAEEAKKSRTKEPKKRGRGELFLK